MTAELVVLIVEDGQEYLESLSRFVPGPRYLQARSAAGAERVLRESRVDLIYLDMRFDRIPRAELAGDHDALTMQLNGDAERAWRHLERNQGLYILDYLRRGEHAKVPVVLAYDFSNEPRRWEHLKARHRRVAWVGDAVTAEEIRACIAAVLESRDA